MLLDSIRRNVQSNASATSSSVVRAAIDYGEGTNGTVELEIGDTNVASRVSSSESGRPMTVAVPGLRLGTLLKQNALGRYALVCDIEGAEAGMFIRDGLALRKCEQLIAELHTARFEGRVWTPEDLSQLLVQEHGFRIVDRYGPVFVFERVGSQT